MRVAFRCAHSGFPCILLRDHADRVDDVWVATNPCEKHFGLYAYQPDSLERFVWMPQGKLEQLDKLAQLRVLENGLPIAINATEDQGVGVDTPEDAARFE